MFRRAFRSFRKLCVVSGLVGVSSFALCADVPTLDERLSLSTEKLVRPDANDTRVYVIIGGGPASYVCAHTLRSAGFKGRIVVVNQGSPVNSILYGKNVSLSPLGSEGFYAGYGVEVLQSAVASVDSRAAMVKLADGTELQYSKLCVANEQSVRVPSTLQNAYKHFQNVVTLQSLADHEKLLSLAPGKNVVIAGLNLKAMGVLEWLQGNVTILDTDDEPLVKTMGHDIANQVCTLLRERGIRIIKGNRPAEFLNTDDTLTGIKVNYVDEFIGKKSEEIATDLFVIPEASHVNNNFLPAGLLSQDGTVAVDSYMKSADSKIYAAGTTINALDLWAEKRVIPEGVEAAKTGAYAAYNMLGMTTTYMSVAHRSVKVGVSVDVVGNTEEHDWCWTETVKEGDSTHRVLVTYFYKDRRCIGAAVYNHPQLALKLANALGKGLMPSPNYWGNELSVAMILSTLDNK